MLAKLLKFELSYHTKQVGFWVTVSVMFLLGILYMSIDDITAGLATGEKIKSNGAMTVVSFVSSFTLPALFYTAVFVVSGIMRDTEHKFTEIIHSTAVSTRDITFSRTIGVFIVSLICLVAFVVGLLAGQFMPWVDAEALGPINLLYFIYPIIVFGLVNILLISSVLSIAAYITRQKVLVYITAIAVFILNIMSGELLNDNVPELLAGLLDPFGTIAMSIDIEGWTASELNSTLPPMTKYLGLNRLLYLLIAIGVFLLSNKLFQRGILKTKTKKNKALNEDVTDSIHLISVTPRLGFSHVMQSFWTRFKYDYLTTIRSIPFLILSLLAVILVIFYVMIRSQILPDAILPTSASLALLGVVGLTIPMLIIIIFFSSEILWRERVYKFNEILDSTSVNNGSVLFGKWIALLAVLITFISVAMLTAMVMQLTISDIPINFGTYGTLTFLNIAPRFLFLTLLAMFLQTFIPNKVLGMVASALCIGGLLFVLPNLPFVHPLMTFGDVSVGAYSEMGGLRDASDFTYFGVFWGSLMGVFAILGIWLFPRGTEIKLKNRFAALRSHITPATGSLAALGVAIFVGMGGYIYKAYDAADFRTRKQAEKRTVAYEKLVKPLENMPLPHITAVYADVDIYSKAREAVVKGRYGLVNKQDVPITTVYVTEPSAHKDDVRVLTLDGARIDTESDTAKAVSKYNYRTFIFEPPLAPGAKTSMAFETFYHAPKLGDGSLINSNGTFVNNSTVMPVFGIQPNYLGNPDRRRKNDLEPREKSPDRDDVHNRHRHFISGNSDYVDFEAKICTDVGQIPIAPGKLRRIYEETNEIGTRACRDYKAINPILNFFSFMSADFDVLEDKYEDIDLRIFYHEEHDYNVELMMDAAKSALKTYTTTFGPYQYEQVRIMEFPYGNFAQAFAGTIPFSEDIGFVQDPGDPEDNESIDLATYVTMHEIGHQWFAHQIVPANTKGFNVLSEGLTENASMTAYEAELGWQKARRVLEQRAVTGYLTGRVADREDEQPLALAEGGQQYLVYNKASWVFWGLKQYMGEDKMQGAIRKFLEDYGSKGAPYPTTKELTDYLRDAAGPDYDQLITDYWDRITLWELNFADDAELDVKPNGSAYTVSLSLEVDKKIASSKDGEETSVNDLDDEGLNEWVEIGFYTQDPKDTLGDEWIKLERVRITESVTELSVDMDERPTYVLIDPRRLLIERNVTDNVKEVPEKVVSND